MKQNFPLIHTNISKLYHFQKDTKKIMNTVLTDDKKIVALHVPTGTKYTLQKGKKFSTANTKGTYSFSGTNICFLAKKKGFFSVTSLRLSSFQIVNK